MLRKLRRFIRELQASEKYDLPYLFGRANPKASLPDRVDWAAALVEWIRHDFEGRSSTAAKIRFLLKWLERHPEAKAAGARTIRSILAETQALPLFIDVGLPTEPTFSAEFFQRLKTVFIPEYLDPTELAGVQSRVFYDDDDPDRLASIPEELAAEVVAWINTGLPAGKSVTDDGPSVWREAARILAARMLAISLREDVRRRGPPLTMNANPFARMGRLLESFTGTGGPEDLILIPGLRTEITEGRRFLQVVRSHLEQTGISVDLVYQLDRLRADLSRFSRLTALLEKVSRGENPLPAFFPLWIEIVRGHQRDGDFVAVFRKNIGLLSRKIVERAGHTGEHYITQTRSEYGMMLVMAAGGGVLTAGTAYLKYAGPHGGPLFVEFAFNAMNYSLSFLLMHLAGFKLATKQPSMTAAALAGKLKEEGGQNDDDAFVDEIARISRSQFAAVVGNLVAVIPAALLLNIVHQMTVGHGLMTDEKARSFLDSVNPVLSATVPYAALTGVLLWLSSMISGWFENASVYARLPDVIRTHPVVRRLFGPARAERLAGAYLHNVSGVVGSIALGVLLAATPIAGAFFGLPLDVRHVTLTTGSAAYAVAAIGWENVIAPVIVFTSVGIAMIGLMNFGVSFALALFIAVRAREMPSTRLRAIFRRAGQRLLRRPGEFFWPVKNAAARTPPAQGT